VNGLRTVCGADGEAALWDRGGWRFFGHYNKGESISDSRAFAMLDEFVDNCPATAAYGKTTSEAVAISLWSGSKTP